MIAILELSNTKFSRLIKKIPRDEFVSIEYQHLAKLDVPIPIGNNQTSSAPSIVKTIIDNAKLTKNKKVLEIGTGSGWQTALMAKLSDHVFTIEIDSDILKTAKKNFDKFQIKNITVKNGNGIKGYPEYAPFDVIVVSASVEKVPKNLINQLKPEGIMIVPVETEDGQKLLKVYSDGFEVVISHVRFVKIKT